MLTAITPTGARPEALDLCARWMRRQDHPGPVRWLVVDDGPEPSGVDLEIPYGWTVVVRPTPRWRPGQNTHARNLLAALDLVGPGDAVVFVEDDDWYPPTWLSACARWLEAAELVGSAPAFYHHVPTGRATTMPESPARQRALRHASLGATAARDGALARLGAICRARPTRLDLHLWHDHDPRRSELHWLRPPECPVGLKGLPGRPGIGVGHRPDAVAAWPEHDLAEWIGAKDAALVQRAIGGPPR